MGYELRREVRALIPPGLLTPLERLLVLEIADECWDSTREGYPGAGVLAALIDRPERSVEETLKSIAKKWLELRVPLGTGKNGLPYYSHRGSRTTFRVPATAILRARWEETTGQPWATSAAAALTAGQSRKAPGKSGASEQKPPENSGASDTPKAPEKPGAFTPEAPGNLGGIRPESPRKSRGPTTNPSTPTPSPTTNPREEAAADAAPVDDDTHTTAVALVDQVRDSLTVPDARELTRLVADALRRGWPREDIAAELTRRLTGLDDAGLGLKARMRKLGPPPAPHERRPARRPHTTPGAGHQPYRNSDDDEYLRWAAGPDHQREPAA